MKVTRSSNNHSNPLLDEKQAEREAWYKIVVKVIRWKELNREGLNNNIVEKITPAEWKAYCDKMIKISVTNGKDKTQLELKEIKDVIQARGGFA